jgi:hypothetical protein
MPSVAFLALKYFSTVSQKRHGFRKKIIEYGIYVLIFSNIFA